jgi:hypothetical protein
MIMIALTWLPLEYSVSCKLANQKPLQTDQELRQDCVSQMPGERPGAEHLRQQIYTQMAAEYGMERRMPFAAVWVGSLRHTVPSEQVGVLSDWLI